MKNNKESLVKDDKKQIIKIDKDSIKSYTKYTWWITLIILVVWVGALILGSFITTWTERLTDEDSYNFWIVLAFVGSSLLIAVPLTIILVNYLTRTVAEVNYHFDKVANGDFNTKLELKSNNVYVKDMVLNFNKMVDQLNSVAIMKNDFVSTFSHEFKTPMVSIKGYAELLCDAENLTAEQLEYVKIIISESKRLSKLAEKVMMLSKLDSQVIVSDKKVFSVNGQIEECILLLDGALQEKNLELISDLKRVRINADAELMAEVWLNLLNNAVKYTNAGGKITVKCFAKDKKVHVIVKDDGIGINSDVKDKIFEKFYQVDGIHSRGGLGLGLTLCKKIVELFNGTITCVSEEGKGAEFTIIIPQNL